MGETLNSNVVTEIELIMIFVLVVVLALRCVKKEL